MIDTPETIRFVSNEWRKVWDGDGTTEEKLTATYIRALEPDCFDFYKPRCLPTAPESFSKEYENYNRADIEKKSELWKAMQSKYKKYFFEKELVESLNLSDEYFLKEMRTHFTNVGLLTHAEKCRLRIQEFEIETYPMEKGGERKWLK